MSDEPPSKAVRGRSCRENPHPQRPDLRLHRIDKSRWALTDGEACIEGDVAGFVDLKALR